MGAQPSKLLIHGAPIGKQRHLLRQALRVYLLGPQLLEALGQPLGVALGLLGRQGRNLLMDVLQLAGNALHICLHGGALALARGNQGLQRPGQSLLHQRGYHLLVLRRLGHRQHAGGCGQVRKAQPARQGQVLLQALKRLVVGLRQRHIRRYLAGVPAVVDIGQHHIHPPARQRAANLAAHIALQVLHVPGQAKTKVQVAVIDAFQLHRGLPPVLLNRVAAIACHAAHPVTSLSGKYTILASRCQSLQPAQIGQRRLRLSSDWAPSHVTNGDTKTNPPIGGLSACKKCRMVMPGHRP